MMRKSRFTVALVIAFVLAVVVAPDSGIASTLKQGSTSYVVRSGDNLSSIARRYGSTVSAIVQANGLADTVIRPGQTLVIPVASGSTGPAPSASRSFSGSTATGGTHIVRSGESLWSIASRYGVSVRGLKAANGLAGDVILPGQNSVNSCVFQCRRCFQRRYRRPARSLKRVKLRRQLYGQAGRHLVFNCAALRYVRQSSQGAQRYFWLVNLPRTDPPDSVCIFLEHTSFPRSICRSLPASNGRVFPSNLFCTSQPTAVGDDVPDPGSSFPTAFLSDSRFINKRAGVSVAPARRTPDSSESVSLLRARTEPIPPAQPWPVLASLRRFRRWRLADRPLPPPQQAALLWR